MPLFSNWAGSPPFAVRWSRNCAGPMSDVCWGNGLRSKSDFGSVIRHDPVFVCRDLSCFPKLLSAFIGYCCIAETWQTGWPCFNVPWSVIGSDLRLTPSGRSGSCRNLMPLFSNWAGSPPFAVRWSKNCAGPILLFDTGMGFRSSLWLI